MVEKAFHCSLPASYRLFLSIHNGWQNWSGDVALLSTEQMLAGKYVERIKEWREETREFNPVLIDDAIVIGFSLFAGEQILVDRSSPQHDIVVWHFAESDRFAEFSDYLQEQKMAFEKALARQKQKTMGSRLVTTWYGQKPQ